MKRCSRLHIDLSAMPRDPSGMQHIDPEKHPDKQHEPQSSTLPQQDEHEHLSTPNHPLVEPHQIDRQMGPTKRIDSLETLRDRSGQSHLRQDVMDQKRVKAIIQTKCQRQHEEGKPVKIIHGNAPALIEQG